MSLLYVLVALMILLLVFGGGYGVYTGNRALGGGNLVLLVLFLIIMVLDGTIHT